MHKILVIDDEIEICKIIDKFLTKHGFMVSTAQSGEQGLELLNKEKFDLLIQDKRMSGIGGLGVLKELKEKKSAIPVIILTGSQDIAEAVDEVKDLGYDDFLFKPIDLNILLENVKRRLGL